MISDCFFNEREHNITIEGKGSDNNLTKPVKTSDEKGELRD
jgi:hypothetical protein